MSATVPIRDAAPAFVERHFSISEIAGRWGLSEHVVRELFKNEAGILRLGNSRSTGRKRRYVTLRVPESIVARVYARLRQ